MKRNKVFTFHPDNVFFIDEVGCEMPKKIRWKYRWLEICGSTWSQDGFDLTILSRPMFHSVRLHQSKVWAYLFCHHPCSQRSEGNRYYWRILQPLVVRVGDTSINFEEIPIVLTSPIHMGQPALWMVGVFLPLFPVVIVVASPFISVDCFKVYSLTPLPWPIKALTFDSFIKSIQMQWNGPFSVELHKALIYGKLMTQHKKMRLIYKGWHWRSRNKSINWTSRLSGLILLDKSIMPGSTLLQSFWTMKRQLQREDGILLQTIC